jgi:hypothetical protein
MDRSSAAGFIQQDRRDQKSAEYEKEIDADHSAGQELRVVGVSAEHQQNREAADTVQRRHAMSVTVQLR